MKKPVDKYMREARFFAYSERAGFARRLSRIEKELAFGRGQGE
jgi:hypothetical protein